MKKIKNVGVFSGLFFTLAFTVGNVAAQNPFGAFPASEESAPGMQTIQSEDDLVQEVSIQEVVYVLRGDQEVKLKLISPSNSADMFGQNLSTQKNPLIIYVQGSAWFYQDNSVTLPRMSKFVADTGYTVASVQYRPSTQAQAPAQLQDVKSAIRFLRVNAARFGIDPERIAVWGDSSGGHMAAMVGTTDGLNQFVTDDNAEASTSVKAVIDFFGPTDFKQMSAYPSVLQHDEATSPESTVIGGAIQDPANADNVAAYNPITYVSVNKALPPFLIMHGDEDPLVPFNQSVLLYNALQEAGQEVSFYKVQGAGHGTRFWTPGVLEIVTDFLATHL